MIMGDPPWFPSGGFIIPKELDHLGDSVNIYSAFGGLHHFDFITSFGGTEERGMVSLRPNDWIYENLMLCHFPMI